MCVCVFKQGKPLSTGYDGILWHNKFSIEKDMSGSYDLIIVVMIVQNQTPFSLKKL